MNEEALIKIQSKVIGLDREFLRYIKDLTSGNSLTSDEHLITMINRTENEINVYNYILKLLILNQNVN